MLCRCIIISTTIWYIDMCTPDNWKPTRKTFQQKYTKHTHNAALNQNHIQTIHCIRSGNNFSRSLFSLESTKVSPCALYTQHWQNHPQNKNDNKNTNKTNQTNSKQLRLRLHLHTATNSNERAHFHNRLPLNKMCGKQKQQPSPSIQWMQTRAFATNYKINKR